MANLAGKFAPAEAENNFDPVPPGEYQVMFVKDEEKDDGSVSAEFSIIGGAHDGRKLWNYFGFGSSNNTAIRIACERMTQLLRAADLPDDTMDTSPAYGKTMIAVVGIQKKDPTRNQINAFKPIGGAPAPAQQAQPAQAAQAAPQKTAMPWEK